ncbi:hypothetical protein AO287_21465 [Pseudomonas savastanoi]|uniref:Uncharacterized protein n=2 Tax=Pseudomonas savastanoi TaxID=29438 RepID=A0AAW3LZK9_PSESS|nr:hypothetical protein AO287_21465 [Pseudomonas savastanoi]
MNGTEGVGWYATEQEAAADWNRRAQPADQQGEPVAHCVERRNGYGEWINDAKSWVDGAPCCEIVEYCAKYPELMRVRLAYAQPATAKVDERLTQATAFVQKLRDAAAGQPSFATGYLSDILDVLQGRAKLNTPQ